MKMLMILLADPYSTLLAPLSLWLGSFVDKPIFESNRIIITFQFNLTKSVLCPLG